MKVRKEIVILVVVMFLIVAATLSLPTVVATTNSNTPSYSVLTALQGIQDALVALSETELVNSAASDVNGVVVEGYCDYGVTAEDANRAVFTVPAGRQFVLRKLYVRHREKAIWALWHLSVDGDILIDGGIVHESEGIKKGVHDFPDNCIVIDAGETLRAVNEMSEDGTYILKITIIGYFRDAQ